jgi:hypothetical protein
MNAARHATTRWLSGPRSGTGRLYSESHAFHGLAAAYSTFLAMCLARALAADDVPARELAVDIRCRFSPPQRRPRVLERLEVMVHGRVEDIEDSAFEDAVRTTWETCSRSLGLREDLHTMLDAALV